MGCLEFGSRETIVGASLLAKAPGQATAMLNVPPLSRAGSLLQGFSGVRKIPAKTQNQCGSGLAREGAGSGNKSVH
ncbi:hypothetical protein EVS84_13450 [Pseudomonas koreensis]|uniref:Uncharacterized protein n=1 Tax=Pseudomonas koreensis TaxID=198620 RepID=A0A4Q4L6H6_9PSED|nr:hypothetical protein EVS84_13450 [Pseudomonas koreensis]